MSFMNGSHGSLAPTDNVQWMQIQKDTFTNWVNEQLKSKGSEVRDLRTDFSDGVKLFTLVEALKRQKLPGTVSKPTNKYEKLQNITVALNGIADDNVRIINIDSKEILEGNSKLILALIWQLVIRYQIGLSNIQHRNWMLAWLQAVLPECSITNFTSDWTDGSALLGLLDFCVPGLYPTWKSCDKLDRENNCRKAMKLARQQFGIPLILRPEYMASPELDEMSAITYLSYFMKVGAPGYNACLQRLQPLVRNTTVFNFTTDWNDGRVLCELVTNLGAAIPSWPEGNASNIDLLQQGIHGGQQLNVDPVVPAADMAEEESEHLGIMAYAARFLNLSPVANRLYSDTVHQQQQVVVLEKRPSLRQMYPIPLPPVPTGHRTSTHVINKETTTKVVYSKDMEPAIRTYTVNPEPEHKVYTIDPQPVKALYANPKQTVTVRHHRQRDPDPSYYVKTAQPHHGDRSDMQRIYSLMNATTGDKPEKTFNFVRRPSLRAATKKELLADNGVKIETFSVGVIITEKHHDIISKDEVRVEALSPTGRIIRMTGDGCYHAHFAADEIGEWNIKVFINGRLVNSCPIEVSDPSQVKVSGIKQGIVSRPQTFNVDCRKAGSGEVEVQINHKRGSVPCYISQTEPNVFQAKYTPLYQGVHRMKVSFNSAEIREADFVIGEGSDGMHRRAVFETDITEDEGGLTKTVRTACDWQIDYVTGGPIEVNMTNTSDVKVYSMQDGTVCATPHLIADCTNAPNGRLEAEVLHNGFRFPAEIKEEKPDVFRIVFRPRGPGLYKVFVVYDGVSVKGSPFIQEIDELTSPKATGEGLLMGMKDSPAKFNVDARGFSGDLSVIITGPNHPVQCTTTPEEDGTHTVVYYPTDVGVHRINIRMDGRDIDKSPFKPRIVCPSRVRVSGGWRPLVDDRERIPLIVNKEKQIPFDASEAGPGELTADIHGPSFKVPTAVDSRGSGKHILVFTPKEEGKHYIDVRWCGLALPNTPYLGFATRQPEGVVDEQPSFQSIIVLNNPDGTSSDSDSSNNNDPRKRKRRAVRKIPSYTSSDSNRKPPRITVLRHRSDVGYPPNPRLHILKHQPSLRSSTTVTDDESGVGGPRISAVYVPTSPSMSSRSSRPPSYKVDNGPKFPYMSPKVVLTGPGLKEAWVGKPTVFYIDGTNAPKGTPDVLLSSVNHEIHVDARPTGPQYYTCFYTPQEPGAYLLNISWNKHPLKCCPLKVNVHRTPEHRPPSIRTSVTESVHINKEPPQIDPISIREGVVGRPIVVSIDTTKLEPGELRVNCTGPNSEIVPVVSTPNSDGTLTVQLRPVGPGRHILNVRLNDKHIFDSPYAIDVRLNPVIGTVDVYGPGIANGILPQFEGQFWVDATNAGAGEIHVSIMGPKGAFRVEMMRSSQKTKVFHCRYNPIEPGVYTVNVFWSGVHIKDSPYTILLGLSEPDLDRMVLERKASINPGPPSLRGSYKYISASDESGIMY
ncbi:Filamin-A [Mizuhopecten yessoensis]|uniref:Filamin-A n=2 Tax=Mizuhopecten yessoensis TaxID=6573 RepID=A0A210QFZ6_MIZYE|nr:Filamin-A [Mizuhopecten yessoensis]